MQNIVTKITGEIRVSSEILDELKKIKNIPSFKRLMESFLGKKTTELAEVLLGGATILDASDLHVEPEEERAKLRLRIDGILQDVMYFDFKIYEALLSRLKILSALKLNITERPQDGRFSILIPAQGKETAIEIRSSTLPTEHGEAVVLRVLNPKDLISMADLGLREDLLSLFREEIEKPNGMTIVTGPTGAGKTTTLYAFLKEIQKPEIKTITIEDPIEYHLEGISQTQVNPAKKYDFANGLRAIVRQDPDVILVGEIRDLETAQIALQAALTGHLVLTTLHTNDAAGTIARLQALGEKPVNIAPAINLAIAQRLVRRVCKKCGQLVLLPENLRKEIEQEIKKLPEGVKAPVLDKDTRILKAKGCEDCNLTGYRGRVAIYEAFLVDDEMERFILTSPSISDLKRKAIEKGMATMYQDGMIKVLQKITTMEEVERVTGE